MEARIVSTVLEALNEAGIQAEKAYPGEEMAGLTEVRAAVSLEKLDYAARSAVVLVSVLGPVCLGGSACEETAIQVGNVLEALGGDCVQEGCGFNGYADAFFVRVRGTFYGDAVMEGWSAASDFKVTVGSTVLTNAVAFRAEQAVDAETGEPLDSAVWTFRLEEKFGWGEGVLPSPTDPFTVTINRSNSLEVYKECSWISIQLEDTDTGLRQVRTGVAKTRSFLVVA